MIVSFSGTVDSISEDGFVVFVGKPGGYKLPIEPEDIALVIRKAFRAGATLEIQYDDQDRSIFDAKLA